MKKLRTPSARSLPMTRKKAHGRKARVLYASDFWMNQSHFIGTSKKSANSTHFVLVQPFPTIAAARQAAKWANLSYEKQVEAIAKSLWKNDSRSWTLYCSVYRRQAEAILTLLGHSAPKAATNKAGKGEK